MKAEFRFSLWGAVAAATLASFACSPPAGRPDGGVDGGPTESCEDDSQCPTLYRCSLSSSTCVPDCTTDSQCAPAGRQAAGATALDFCPTDTSCRCDYTQAGGECTPRLCSADSDCGTTLVCRSGKCEAAPTAATVTRCLITPDFAIVKSGGKVRFWVSAWNNANPVVVREGATWAAAMGSPLTAPMPAGGLSSEFTASMTATTGGDGVAAVEATFGSTKCTAKALVVGAPAAGNASVVVSDELTGRPITGAKVLLSGPDGAAIGQAVDTGASGVASLPLNNATVYSASVFHPDYSYLTIANYRPSGADANVLSAVLRRTVARYGGFKGTFDGVPTNTDIKAGIASMSLAGAITSLNLGQLLGPSRMTRIKVGPFDDTVNVPDGVFLVVNETNKNAIAGLGLNGVCTDGTGAADETKIRSGSCGTRSAWGFSGAVKLGDISPLITAFMGMGANLNIGNALGQLTPLIRQLKSSIVRDVQFDMTNATCTGTATFPNCVEGYNYSNIDGFNTANMKFADVALAFGFALKSARLPSYRGKPTDGALAIAGVNVPGRGVIPLGIGAAVNTATPIDDVLDKQETLPAAGLLPVRMAPSHSGTEGTEYGIIAASLAAASATDVSAQVGASALYVRLPDNKLPFDPRGAQPVDISAQIYPVLPETARINAHSGPVLGIPARSFRFVNAAVATALGTSVQVVRVTFSDQLSNRWDVLFDAARAAEGFTLPAPPAGTRDRLFKTGIEGTARSELVVQTMRLSTAPTVAGQPAGPALTFQGLVEFNATNFDRLTNFMTGFSFLDFAEPKPSFKTDLKVPVPDGGKIVVKVEKFKIGTAAGDEGLVKLSFAQGANPVANCATMSSSTELVAGKGEVEFTLPAECTATGVTVKAQLFYDANTPVLPEVSVTESNVTLQ